MEDVLSVCHIPYDSAIPQICMDESSKQLVDEVKIPIPARPGNTLRYDDEYIRKGVAEIFMFVEPLAGWRHVEVTQRRTKKDWALQIRELLEVHYPHATKVRLVLDNLNTHSMSSLYETFPENEARNLAKRLEIHYTPKHGSWLNMAEIEISALQSQCLSRRIPNTDVLKAEIAAWEVCRNNRTSKINWQFRNEDARVKLKKSYPKF